jgi:dTDP-4-dehydrorhamnose reductase
VKILVTGREGQVARSLAEKAAGMADLELVFAGRPELDLAQVSTIAPAVLAAAPDVVVSAAAFTDVETAEDQADLAFAVNAEGAGEVARSARALGVPVIHLSTDFVFDGSSRKPYREEDPTWPLSVYGASKLAGEHLVAEANPRSLILRTAWVYSPFGRNFVKTMLEIAARRPEIAVVGDQRGNPTSALDIAETILHLARRLVGPSAERIAGTYHLAGTGFATRYRLAEFVMETSRALGGPHAALRRVSSRDYATKAKRPANSCLSTERLSERLGYTLPHWHASCRTVVERLVRGGGTGTPKADQAADPCPARRGG